MRAQLERRAYGAVDFATHLRMAAVTARLRQHADSLKHCRASIRALQQSAEQADAQADGELRVAFQAHLAVAYHNAAVALAQNQHLQEASAAAKLAQELAAATLPAKHKWVHSINSTSRLLADMHLSTSFVTEQMRLPQVPA